MVATAKKVSAVIAALALAAGATACATDAGEGEQAAADGGLPDTMIWSTYPVGTTTYNDMAAVAEMVTSDMERQVRITPSDTAIGRMTPLLNGQAMVSRTGDEYIFSFEGEYDFAQEQHGPTPTRVVFPVEARQGFTVLEGSGIEDFTDLQGKKVPNVTANPSVNQKIDALLAYSGLSRDDVELVDVAYGDQPSALETGQVDAIFYGLYGSPLFELASSKGVKVLSMEDDSQEAMDRLLGVSRALNVGEFANGPGMEEGEAIQTLKYPLPVVALESASADAIEELVTGFVDNFDSYAETTPTTADWALDEIPKVPTVVPFHEGFIAYLDAQGEWSDEAQQANDELLEREAQMTEAWGEYVEQADEIDHESWVAFKEDALG